MKNIIKYLLLAFTVVSLSAACSDKKDNPADYFDVQFELPSSVEFPKGGEYIFSVKDGKHPETTDQFMVEAESGVSYICPIVKASSDSFVISLPDGFVAGNYRVFIKRESRKKPFGMTYINIVESLDFEPDPDSTIYGVVSTSKGGVANVVVSDGKEVTVTNEKGIYQLKSEKKRGSVFISVPSGYEVPSNGVLPQFSFQLKGAADQLERVDFALKEVENQDAYKVFMLGDMHLANRTNDNQQFMDFTSDISTYMNEHKGEKMYAIALGDMTWDLYWYSNNYFFPEYLKAINSGVKDLQIFHVMGNHDNDFKGTSDFTAEIPYMEFIAPTYYSFNIGKVHYVVLDDIDCSDYDGTDSRNYKKTISQEQLDWLKKDLAYVDKGTPVVMAMHAQVFYPSILGGFRIDHDVPNTKLLFDILDGYKVHFVTGHTHMIFNVNPEESVVGGQDFYEHNSGSICASWWWSGSLTPGVHISLDGAPGGYGIWDVAGTDLKWKYKSTGWPEEYQFRSYDLNKVHFSMNDVPLLEASGTAAAKRAFQKYVDAYPVNSDNEVLINIWNWNPNWTVEVVDADNNKLNVRKVWAYDPLHIAALSVKRFNQGNLKSAPAFVTEMFTHFFKVKAKDADVDLKITVKDEFGNTWTENMQRPKVFSTDAYKSK